MHAGGRNATWRPALRLQLQRPLLRLRRLQQPQLRTLQQKPQPPPQNPDMEKDKDRKGKGLEGCSRLSAPTCLTAHVIGGKLGTGEAEFLCNPSSRRIPLDPLVSSAPGCEARLLKGTIRVSMKCGKKFAKRQESNYLDWSAGVTEEVMDHGRTVPLFQAECLSHCLSNPLLSLQALSADFGSGNTLALREVEKIPPRTVCLVSVIKEALTAVIELRLLLCQRAPSVCTHALQLHHGLV